MEKIVTLTELQFKTLLTAQSKLSQIEEAVRSAQSHLDMVTSLILDAHGVTTTVDKIELNASNRSLVINTKDE